MLVGFPSSSGSQLQGWWMPAVGQGRGIVVLMHDVRANRLQMAGRAEILQRHNFSVLLFNFQAHGESQGQRLTFGRLEGLDAAAAVRLPAAGHPASVSA